MTRDDWITRYAARMVAGASAMTEAEAIDSATIRAEASESAGWVDPDEWEDPGAVADEDLAAEGGG